MQRVLQVRPLDRPSFQRPAPAVQGVRNLHKARSPALTAHLVLAAAGALVASAIVRCRLILHAALLGRGAQSAVGKVAVGWLSRKPASVLP